MFGTIKGFREQLSLKLVTYLTKCIKLEYTFSTDDAKLLKDLSKSIGCKSAPIRIFRTAGSNSIFVQTSASDAVGIDEFPLDLVWTMEQKLGNAIRPQMGVVPDEYVNTLQKLGR